MQTFWIVCKSLEAIPWLSVVPICISLAFLGTAIKALSTWQRELQTRRVMQFLDDFNDSFYELCEGLPTACSYDHALRNALRDRYTDYERNHGSIDRKKLDWAEDFLDNTAASLARLSNDRLNKIDSANNKLRALVSKGHVLHMRKYSHFQSNCDALNKRWLDSIRFTNNIIQLKDGPDDYITILITRKMIYDIVDMPEADFF